MKNVKLNIWWNKKTAFEKVLFVIEIAVLIAVLVSAVLFTMDVWEEEHWIVFSVGMVIVWSIHAYKEWKDEKRGMAIWSLSIVGLNVLNLVLYLIR